MLRRCSLGFKSFSKRTHAIAKSSTKHGPTSLAAVTAYALMFGAQHDSDVSEKMEPNCATTTAHLDPRPLWDASTLDARDDI
jgi:hypothetical protein